MNPTRHRYKKEGDNEAEGFYITNWLIREYLKFGTFTNDETFKYLMNDLWILTEKKKRPWTPWMRLRGQF
jgi:hypothetical protein